MGHRGQAHARPASDPQAAGRRTRGRREKKTLGLLPRLQALWDACGEAFAQQRTAQRARRLGLSQLACVGRHTLTGLLYAAGRQFVDWSGDYRLYARDRWKPADLFRPVIAGVLDLLPEAAPFRAALDDTLLRKTGTRIPGATYHRDPMSPPFHVNLVRGQRFLQLSALLPSDDPDGPARGIPIRFEHAPSVPKPGRQASAQEHQAYRARQRIDTLTQRGAGALHQVRAELDRQPQARGRAFIVSVDGGYTNQTVLKRLPERTTLIGRIRRDAELFHPPCPQDRRAVGGPRQYGLPAPTPEALRCDDAVPWGEVTAFAAGKRHALRVKTIAPILWKKAGAQRPLRLVVIAPLAYRLGRSGKALYRRPAYLICTDPDRPVDQVVQDYLWRWEIEVNHRDEKQIIGVGQAQVRSARSVERQPAFAVASYALLLLAAEQAARSSTPDTRDSTPAARSSTPDTRDSTPTARSSTPDTRDSTPPARSSTEMPGLPPPKWQAAAKRPRPSTQELIRQLRSELWSHGLKTLCADSDRFVTPAAWVTKCPESQFPAASTLLYAATG